MTNPTTTESETYSAPVRAVIEAAAKRQQAFAAADDARRQKYREADVRFVRSVTRAMASDGVTMTELAKAAGINRVNLHKLVSAHSSTTT